MTNKRINEQTKAENHLKDLLEVDRGLTQGQLKWIEIFNKKMIAKEMFSERTREIIYDIYQYASDKGLL